MRFFLGTHRPGFVLVRVVKPGFLIDGATTFDNCDLAACLVFDGRLNEPHGVHVLDLATGAEMGKVLRFLILLVLARAADRHVHVGPQVAVLHVAVASAKVAQDLAQLGDIGGGLFGAADIGPRHDLHQRDTGAVQVDKGHVGIHVVDRFPGVLLKVNPLDPHKTGDTVPHINQNFTFTDDRMVKL